MAQNPAGQDPGQGMVLPDIEVVGTTPLQGGGQDRDRVPTNTEVLRREDLERSGPASTLRALDERVGGVALNEAQGNPFQPNLVYRGFEASPLAGNAQGLAVYLNGTRFNQPFGDTTNWDLVPDIAVDRIEVVGSNPAFGLNALGGAITVKLRDGFSYHGTTLELSGGSFGRIQGSAQYGVQAGNVAGYVATTVLNEDGWRDHSPSQLRRIYGDLGWRGDRSEVHLSLLGAINNLAGNGPAPLELLQQRRSAVFTYPDETRNKYLRLSLTGSHEVNDSLSLQGSAYYSNLAQRTFNGDAADTGPCGDDPQFLCVTNGPNLATAGGGRIANFLNPGLYPGVAAFEGGGPYAVQNQTTTNSNGYGATVQATYKSDLIGRPNRLLVGASYDGGSTSFSARSYLGTLALDRGFAGPGVLIDSPDASITPVRLGAQNNYYGLYIQDTLDVTPALALTLSGRFNYAAIELRDRLGTELNGNHAFNRFNPGAGLTYKITPDISLYGGYSEANRTPTPAELSCASPGSPCSLTNFFVADPPLKQVVARTFEAGLRGRSKLSDTAQLTWNAGVFRTDSDDDILFTASTVTGRGFFHNVGSTRRQGVEAGLGVQQGSLSAFLDYAYTDATFRTPFTLSSQNNPAADQDGLIAVRSGNQIPGIPQHRLKFGVQYDITPEWTVGTTGIASSGRFLRGDEGNQNAKTGAYVILNASTSYRINKNVEVFGLAQNLLNTRYETFGAFSPVSLVPISATRTASNPRSVTPGAPIAGYGGVRVTF